jgi:anti-anti-sigma regulatory factor
MLKIEIESNGSGHLIRLIGRIRREHLEALDAKIVQSAAKASLDLREVTLVDVDVVRYLLKSERDGIELRHCPPFVREWIECETSAGDP